jgi:hypothetical protein
MSSSLRINAFAPEARDQSMEKLNRGFDRKQALSQAPKGHEDVRAQYPLASLLSNPAPRTFSLSRASLTGFVELAVGIGGPETFFSAMSGLSMTVSILALTICP